MHYTCKSLASIESHQMKRGEKYIMSDIEMHLDVAEDGGNGYQKTAIQNEVFVYPSQIVESNIPKGASKDSGTMNSNDTSALQEFFGNEAFKKRMNVTVYSEGLLRHDTGLTYFVGDNAEKTFNEIEAYDVATNTNKSKSDISLISLLSLIGYYSAKKYWSQYQAFPKEDLNVVVDRLITALPLNEFKRNGVSASFADRFKNNNHTVVLNNFDLPVTVHIRFSYVNVMPEGLASVMALIYDPKSPLDYRNDDIYSHVYFNSPEDRVDITGESITNKSFLLIDIGDGSTDCIISEGLDNNLYSSSGLEQGIGTCAQKAIDYLNAENPNNVRMTRQKFLQTALEGDSSGARVYRETFEAQLPPFFTSLDDKVTRMLTTYKSNVDFVIVSGGGASMVEKYHIEDFQKIVKYSTGVFNAPIIVIPEKYSQLLNLSGLQVLLYRMQQAHFYG